MVARGPEREAITNLRVFRVSVVRSWIGNR
jgi:hypothetical protein